MARETGKDRPEKAGKDAEGTNSNYAMPENMSAALQKLIVGRLMKVSREVRRLETATEKGLGAAVGWEDMPAAAREFHARSAQDNADEDLGVAVTDD